MTIYPHITSTSNAFVKHLVALSDRKAREQHGQFLAEGIRTCSSLLQSSLTCEKLLVTEKMLPQAEIMVSHEVVVVVSEPVMHKISPVATPSGMVGLFNIPKQLPLEQISSGLVLANIMDPGNMGTLIRTAVAFNKPTIILIGGVDPWNPKAVQASAGTIGNSALYTLSWEAFFSYANKNKYDLFALVVRDGKNPHKFDYREKHFLVVGGEAQGIPAAWIEQCTHRITLPMPGPAESLNAGIAGSLALALAYWQTIRC